jgi:peptidyl-prolyl cis-trans isomerase C
MNASTLLDREVRRADARTVPSGIPSVNGVPLAADVEPVDDGELRRRAGVELLRQAAQHAGLLDADDPPPVAGAISEAAGLAIESYLEREATSPQPDESACRRWYAAHASQLAQGERVRLRHLLFAVTPGVDVGALRRRAEACLVDLRAVVPGAGDRFAEAAAGMSNCPSGAQGGDLGWLTVDDCAPEFAREVFGRPEVGVLPRLVHSRFGLHVVEVLEREPGRVPAYEAVQGRVRRALERQAFATAVRHLLLRLAADARLVGVDLEAAQTPLVQ